MITLDPSLAWYGQALLALLVLLLIAIATARTWDQLHPGWRRVLVLGVVEHAVIAYGAWEARHLDVPVELRVFLMTLTLVGLAIALVILLLEDRREHLPDLLTREATTHDHP